ncbi:hypothetical protein [Cupriavidus sp. PET2-C1]
MRSFTPTPPAVRSRRQRALWVVLGVLGVLGLLPTRPAGGHAAPSPDRDRAQS